eukprot:1642926-Rhodomonas_salina.1
MRSQHLSNSSRHRRASRAATRLHVDSRQPRTKPAVRRGKRARIIRGADARVGRNAACPRSRRSRSQQ